MAEKKTEWVKMKPAELEKLVIELHKAGESPAKIGLILRDKHGVPKSKLISKKVTQMLHDNKLEHITEKKMFQNKIDLLNKHILTNKHDYTAKRSLGKRLWSVKKLT